VSSFQPIIIDTNILFSCLLQNQSQFTKVIQDSNRKFYICESTIVEIFKSKEKIVRLSKLSEQNIVRLFYMLLRQINVSKEALIEPEIREQAYQLCADIDETDAPQLALTIHLNGLLWTGDQALKKGLQKKGFTRFFIY